MENWYCFIAGRQYGPVSRETLWAWSSESRLTTRDYLWREGMSDWALAGQALPELFIIAPATSSPPPIRSMVVCPPPGGTAGQKANAQITKAAREHLHG